MVLQRNPSFKQLALLKRASLLLLLQRVWLGGCSRFDPHDPDQAFRSWFEGWYLRVVTDADRSDADAPATLGVITGYIPRGQPAWNSTLIQVMLQSRTEQQARYEINLNEQLRVSASGDAVRGDPDPASPPNFAITAPQGRFEWNMKGDACNVSLRGHKISLTVTCVGQPISWDPRGPEGWVSNVPTRLTGLHWYVHSLGTPIEFQVQLGEGHPLRGRGWAHMEKNWGMSFPSEWVWAQGLLPQKRGEPVVEPPKEAQHEKKVPPELQAVFALAGGQLPAPWAPSSWLPDLWLLGVRTANYSWDFHPWDSLFTIQSSPCASPLLPNATFNITAVQLLHGREVSLEISAPPASFFPASGPTREGFIPYSVESYEATSTLRLFQWELNLRGEKEWLQKRLLQAHTVPSSALELGGGRRCAAGQSTMQNWKPDGGAGWGRRRQWMGNWADE